MRKLISLVLLILLAVACQQKSADKNQKSIDSNLSQKEMQYYSNGQKLYGLYCSNCHTEQGVGLGRLIPPLKASDYLMSDLSRAASIIKYGQDGPITVNGIEFNQPMPANPQLKNLEIAELITYISNSWGNSAKGFTTEQVEESIQEKVGDQ